MKRFAWIACVCPLLMACGGNDASTPDASGVDGGGNDGATTDVPVDAPADGATDVAVDAPADAATDVASTCDGGKPTLSGDVDGGAACRNAIDATQCLRCWPAWRDFCAVRPNVVTGLLACLVIDPNACWDLFDPNTAGPCMQTVIDAENSADVNSVQSRIQTLGGTARQIVGFGAIAAMLPDAQRTAFAACVNAASSETEAEGCIMCATSVDESKCQ